MIAVQGSPSKATTQIDDPNLHLVPVEYAKALQVDYLPAKFDYEDYPKLIEKGQQVDTIGVPAVLAAYNWAPNTDRYRRLAHFVEVFFARISDFQKPPFHPKWKEVSLIAPLPGWTRFKPAQDWLEQHRDMDQTAASDGKSRLFKCGDSAFSCLGRQVQRQVLASNGGIAPALRRRALVAPRLEKREEISRGIAAGRLIRRIAQGLERSPQLSAERSGVTAAAAPTAPARLISAPGGGHCAQSLVA